MRESPNAIPHVLMFVETEDGKKYGIALQDKGGSLSRTYRHFAQVMKRADGQHPHTIIHMSADGWKIERSAPPDEIEEPQMFIYLTINIDHKPVEHVYTVAAKGANEIWQWVADNIGRNQELPHVLVELTPHGLTANTIAMAESFDWGDDGQTEGCL